MIIYFSGTGNSRYLAKQLAQQLDDDLIDATVLIKTGEHPAIASEKPYIFVAPVYAWRFPRVLADWMRKCTFTGDRRVYFVLTCGGEIGAADRYLEAFCKELSLCYMGTGEVVMPENYLVMFDPPPQEKDTPVLDASVASANGMARQIREGLPFPKRKSTLVGRLSSGIVNSCFYTFYIGAKKFRATDACVSCGKCAEVCMLNNISIKDNKPVWGKNCTHCMACICRCPAEAIEYGKHTSGRRRYVCPREKD